jgi:two-component system sensor histidine kinase/response regulator
VSIRLRLFLPLFVLGLALTAYLLFIWVPQSRSEKTRYYLEQTRAHLSTLAEAIVDPLLKNDLGQIYSTLDSLLVKNPHWIGIQLLSRSGDVLYPGSAVSMDPGMDMQDPGTHISLTQAVFYRDRAIGSLVLRADIVKFLDAEMRALWVLLSVLLAAIVAYVLLAVLATEWAVRRPLALLASASARLGQGDFSASLPPARNDEIGDLVRNFNSMRQAIYRTEQELRHEIEARERSEDALRASERRLSAVLDGVADGTIIISEHGVVESYNQAAANIFGYSPPEVIGKNVAMLMPEPHRSEHDGHLRRYRDGGEKRVIGKKRELEARRSNGTTFPLELSVSEVLAGKQRLFVGILRDITERQRADKTLRDAHDAAVEASRVKSEFLANMSHEIRTPLHGLLGMLDLLRDIPMSEEQRTFLDSAHKSGRALLSLVNDTLDFSRIEAGRMAIQQRPFDFPAAIESAIGELDVAIRGKGLELGCFIDPPLFATVQGDPERLRQVLVNLLANAAKFTEHGEIFVRVVRLESQAHRLRVRIEVQDTGCGIPPSDQERIFDAFTQADGSTTRRFGGSGLGLTLCRKLVDLMGGQIGVESEPGRGSRFWFTLSLTTSVSTAASESDPRFAGRRALVIGDTLPPHTQLAQRVESSGMLVVHADSAEEALEQLQRACTAGTLFDSILIGTCYPHTRGVRCAQRLVSHPAWDAGWTVHLPSFGPDVTRHALIEAGLSPDRVRPLLTSQLRDGLLGVSSRVHGSEPSMEAVRHGRLLVAEDNSVNQQVIVAMLKHFGLEAVLASDGQAALEQFARGGIDLVLMDCQMPGIDGYAATRMLREHEEKAAAASGVGTRIPIIAMTANVMPGDRERCLAAGMDDYLAKPVLFEVLAAMLAKWLGKGRDRQQGVAPDQADRSARLFAEEGSMDLSRLRVMRTMLEETFPSLLQVFVEDTPRRVTLMHDALGGGDRKGLQDVVHMLKGSSANMGAVRLASLCRDLELAITAQDARRQSTLLEAIGAESRRVIDFLRAELRDFGTPHGSHTD